MALWWLEEGSANGFHFDQAALDFQVARHTLAFSPFDLEFQGLPSEVKERFLWRAIIIMHDHPLVSCNHLICGNYQLAQEEEEEDGEGSSSQ